jgi:hypothetical protein
MPVFNFVHLSVSFLRPSYFHYFLLFTPKHLAQAITLWDALSRSTDYPEGTVPIISQQWLPSESLQLNNNCRPSIRLSIAWFIDSAIKLTVHAYTTSTLSSHSVNCVSNYPWYVTDVCQGPVHLRYCCAQFCSTRNVCAGRHVCLRLFLFS